MLNGDIKMKKAILIIAVMLLMLNFAAAATQHYYEFYVVYNNSELSYNSLAVKPLIEGQSIWNFAGEYKTEIISTDNKVLNSSSFRVALKTIDDSFDSQGRATGGEITIKNQSIERIHLPYFDNAKEINIYDINGTKKLTIDVTKYSKNITETVAEVKPAPTGNITGKPEEKEAKNANMLVAIGIGAAIALLFLFLLIKMIKKKE